MRLGLCTAPTTPLPSSIPDFLEVNVQGFLDPTSSDEAFRQRLSEATARGLPLLAANCFLPARLPCVGPSVDRPAVLAWSRVALERAGQAGIRTVVFGSGGARTAPAGWPVAAARDQFVDLLRDLAPLAARAGVVIALEPLNPGETNLVTTVAEGVEVVQRVHHPSVRLLADLYHMALADEDPAILAEVTDLLVHVHLAEAPARTAPGTAGYDFRPALAHLHRGGYTGPLSLECGWDDLTGQLPGALAEVRRQWAEALAPEAVLV